MTDLAIAHSVSRSDREAVLVLTVASGDRSKGGKRLERFDTMSGERSILLSMKQSAPVRY